MIEMAASFEPTPLFALFLLLGMGALFFTVYGVIIWRINRRSSRQPRIGEIKWRRRIEAMREMESE